MRTGEEFEQVVNYVPRFDQKGALIGYEEPAPRWSILRSLDGRRVGVRYSDLRSRGTNPGGEGLSVIVAP
jgi:hypothetical protein